MVIMAICSDLRFSLVTFKKIMQIGALLAKIENLCSSSEEANDNAKESNENGLKQS